MNRNWRPILSFVVGVLVLGLMAWGIYEGISSLVEKLQPEQPGDTAIALSAGFVPAPSVVAAALPAEEAIPPNPVEAQDASGAEKKEEPKAPPSLFEIQGSVQRDGRPIPSGKVRLTVSLVGERFRQSTLTDLKGGEFQVRDHPAFRRLRPKNRIRVVAEVWPASGARKSEPLAETIYLNHHLPSWIRSTGYAVVAGLLLFTALFLWSFTGRSTYAKNRLAIILSYLVIFIGLGGTLAGPTLLMLGMPDLPEISGRVPVGLVVATLTKDSNPEWMLNIGGYVKKGDGQETTTTQATGGVAVAEPPAEKAAEENEDIGAPVLRVVTLNGGIQIPLYVILLALIGGAINMTRKVPEFQSQQPDQGGLFRWMAGGQQQEEHKDDDGDNNRWRKGLLDQYMFLVAAPFLAIATYYLLILLGTIQPPIIVLVCFSIGLISDRVVNAITKAAEKLLGGEDEEGGQPAPEETEAEAKPERAPVAPIRGEQNAEEAEEEEEKAA